MSGFVSKLPFCFIYLFKIPEKFRVHPPLKRKKRKNDNCSEGFILLFLFRSSRFNDATVENRNRNRNRKGGDISPPVENHRRKGDASDPTFNQHPSPHPNPRLHSQNLPTPQQFHPRKALASFDFFFFIHSSFTTLCSLSLQLNCFPRYLYLEHHDQSLLDFSASH